MALGAELPPLYTIGYGSRTLEAFVELLLGLQVRTLVDVRSQPYSRYRVQFCREPLAEHLEARGVAYAWMGDTLGGRPSDQTCYTGGRVDYEKCRATAWYADGIQRLCDLHARQCPCAVMCSEGRPTECHRTRLIAETLVQQGLPVLHIDEDGLLQGHDRVWAMLTGHQPSLFGPELSAHTSRRRYDL